MPNYEAKHTVDKTTWPDGPWQDEHDNIVWTDKDTGYKCIVQRTKMGHLCGYVEVPKPNLQIPSPAVTFNLDDPDISVSINLLDYYDSRVTVHGGVTWTNEIDLNGIHYDYVVGFDCAHTDDYVPNMHFGTKPEAYRNVEYVMEQCHLLAKQLKDLENDS